MTIRNIVEWSEYTTQASQLGLSAREVDEVLLGASLTAARNPEVFRKIPDTQFRVILTDEFPGISPVRIFFMEKNADTIEFVWIERVPDPTDPI